MDQTQNQKQQSLCWFMKSQLHKKLAQTLLLLSVSVFSLFFSYSYWLSLLYPFNSNFHNSLLFQLFSHAIDKNCIVISSSSMYNDDHYFKSYESNQSIDLEPKAPLLDNEAALDNTIDQAIENNNVIEEEKWGLKITTKEEEVEEIIFIGEDKVLYVPAIEESENFEEEEEEEEYQDYGKYEIEFTSLMNGKEYLIQEEEEENRNSSTEELNKRFDEFITKMKEELKIKARQQLVTV
ncbi:hypothetical protein ES332_A13G161300v1 [Gossypium tomentosum]|uniref:Uncharacterized protein n=1 Tax=Gossypium tomentosum TaxID=34277 RepID=A0A5D2ML79_GOSTO|nr:hypothetical protein ES332_A13G161300v1 [Gossypium tomentosum]